MTGCRAEVRFWRHHCRRLQMNWLCHVVMLCCRWHSVLLSSVSDVMMSSDDQYGPSSADKVLYTLTHRHLGCVSIFRLCDLCSRCNLRRQHSSVFGLSICSLFSFLSIKSTTAADDAAAAATTTTTTTTTITITMLQCFNIVMSPCCSVCCHCNSIEKQLHLFLWNLQDRTLLLNLPPCGSTVQWTGAWLVVPCYVTLYGGVLAICKFVHKRLSRVSIWAE